MNGYHRGLGETVSFAGSTVGMLRAFGINDTQATMAASGMFWTVGGSNVHAPVTQVIVRAVQRALNHLGENVLVDGLMSRPTQAAMLRQLGPGFGQMTWAGVFSELRNRLAKRNSDFILDEEPDLLPMGDFGGVGVGALLGLGFLGYFMFGRKGRR
jgi:hypothetical protein